MNDHPLSRGHTSIAFRQLNLPESRNHRLQIPQQTVKLFWDLPLQFLAKNLVLRTFHHLLPSCDRLVLVGVVNSNQCRLCSAVPDSAFHFMVGCPIRCSIWTELFIVYFPFCILHPSAIYDAILSRKLSSLPSISKCHFLKVTLTDHWAICRAYWRLYFDSIQAIALITGAYIAISSIETNLPLLHRAEI